MTRSLLAPLSPNEERTLRRVAIGLSDTSALSARDLAHLEALALVDPTADRPRLTDLGRKRYGLLTGGAAWAGPERYPQ